MTTKDYVKCASPFCTMKVPKELTDGKGNYYCYQCFTKLVTVANNETIGEQNNPTKQILHD